MTKLLMVLGFVIVLWSIAPLTEDGPMHLWSDFLWGLAGIALAGMGTLLSLRNELSREQSPKPGME